MPWQKWPGEKVVEAANVIPRGFAEYWGRNWGPWVKTVLNASGFYHPEPYCGAAAYYVVRQSGLLSTYGGDYNHGVVSASTGEMCRRARMREWLYYQGKPFVPPGSLWIRCGVHTAIVKRQTSRYTVETFGGNESNGFRDGIKSLIGAYVIIPPGLERPLPPPIDLDYVFDDLKAQPFFFPGRGMKPSRWRDKVARDRRMVELSRDPNWRALHPRPYRSDNGWYYIMVGAIKRYGPFSTMQDRDLAFNVIARRLGRRIYRDEHGKIAAVGMAKRRVLDPTPDE